jgi:parallel beta-helix repeat protein
MTLHNLTLADATRGLWVRNVSDDVALSHITTYGHTSDGIRIDGGSTSDVLDFLITHDNGGDGVRVNALIGGVSDSVSFNNDGDGFTLLNIGDAIVEANIAYGNTFGFDITKGSSGTQVVVGNSDLSLGRGNIVYNNATYGIQGGGGVLIVGNTVYGHTGANDAGIDVGGGIARLNVVYGNYDGIRVSSGTVENNRVYANSNRGIYASPGNATVTGNVIYSNRIGIVAANTNTIRNNLIYDNTDYGIYSNDGSSVIESNTIHQLTGDAVRIGGTAANVLLRNNIFSVQGGRAITVSNDSQVGFDSDFNWFFLDGAGAITGEWQSVDRITLTDWRNAGFTDFNSYIGDPLS